MRVQCRIRSRISAAAASRAANLLLNLTTGERLPGNGDPILSVWLVMPLEGFPHFKDSVSPNQARLMTRTILKATKLIFQIYV